MMAEIDTRFLSVHPRTELWWAQREQCQRCAHMSEDGDTTNGLRKSGTLAGGMRCLQAARRIGGGAMHWGRSISIYCIDARDETGKCGPDAKLFKELKHGSEVRKHVRAADREQPQA